MATTRLYLKGYPGDVITRGYLKIDEHGWYYQTDEHLELVDLPCGVSKSDVRRVSHRTQLQFDARYIAHSDLDHKEYRYKNTVLVQEYPYLTIVGPTLKEVRYSARLLRAGKLRPYTPATNAFARVLRRFAGQPV